MIHFDTATLNEEYLVLEKKTQEPTFWDDVEGANAVIEEMNAKKAKLETYDELTKNLASAEEMLDMLSEGEDADLVQELEGEIRQSEKILKAFQLETLLNGPYDANNAILSIHAGAGGTEATDWASMLYRMYTRYLDDNHYKYTVLEYNDEGEGGIKAATLMVKGRNAYGYLKGEKGVHRLVRISPFDSAKRRHTSFASLDVYPELDNTVEIDIDQKDLRVDTYRSTGAGGQHVNTTDSAIRITHLPTGVTVSCQSERSQIQNRETAMNMLKAKLTQIKLEENKQEISDIQGKYTQIAWGSQIRSYVFHPYSMVKDHRTGEETGNVQKVMDGDLNDFINAYLTQNAKETNG